MNPSPLEGRSLITEKKGMDFSKRAKDGINLEASGGSATLTLAVRGKED